MIFYTDYQVKSEDSDTTRMANGWGEFLFNNLGIELDWSDIEEEK